VNIVLLNHYAGSPQHGMEYRPYYLARQWTGQGHSVTIVAASASHVRRTAPAMGDTDIQEEWIDGIRYLWVRTPSYEGNGGRRAANIGAFVARVRRAAGRIAALAQPDVVIASSTYPLDIVPAEAIARHASAGLVYEVHDLWPLSPIELGGMSPRHPFIRVMQWAEDRAYRIADRVVSLLPNTLSHMVSRGMSPHKFAYVPNGVDVDEWKGPTAAPPPEHAATLAALRAAGQLIVGYAGSHGVANALDTMLDAAALLRDEAVQLVLVGHGPEKGALVERARAEGLSNVTFLDPVAKRAVPALLAQFDVACLTLQRQPLFRFGVSPNKLFDYMMAGRPVLQAIDAGNDPVTEAACGISVAGESARALADAVRRFAAMSSAEREAMGAAGHRYVLEHHTYPVLASRFLDVLRQAARTRARDGAAGRSHATRAA